jgi:8-oxo-dGTP diphosphatase
MLTVVAALIESQGKLLVCQRRRGESFALQWEFPGGKMRPNETPAHALASELQEELGIQARIGREIYRTQHRYAELSEPIQLIFFTAAILSAEPQNLVFEQIAWRAPQSLPELNFLPADRELIEKLSTGALRIS